MTYPPPPGTPDPYGQQQPSQDPFAAPPAYDPTTPPPPPPPAYDPYGQQQPVSPPPSSPYTQPPASPNPYDPYAAQPQPTPQYGVPAPQYGQPYGVQPQYPYGPQVADPNKQNGLAIGGMATGIASIIFCCCWPLGLAAGITGLILSIIGRKQITERGGQGAGMALTGIICGAVGILLSLGYGIFSLSGAGTSWMNDIINNSQGALY